MSTSTSSEFAFEAKSFLESCVNNVKKHVQEYHMKDNLRQLGERKFYLHYIDRIQIKFFLYKLNEFKLRAYAEDNFQKKYLVDSEKKKVWEDCRKDTDGFLKHVTKKVCHDYHGYTAKVGKNVVQIQKRVRGCIVRLVHKMDKMNLKIECENKRAENNYKLKLEEKRKSSNQK